jgi:D-3-phosphoglycerate dehydrogenase
MPDDEAKLFFARYGLESDFGLLQDKKDVLGSYHAVIAGTETIGSVELDRMKLVRVIEKFGVGLDNIDVNEARRRGIAVINMPGINSKSVAEMALGLMLAAARRICSGDRAVRAGNWARLKGTSLENKTLGIIGTGSIGRILSSLVSGFCMNVVGFDLFENGEFIAAGGTYVKLETLLKESDFISIHVPLTDKTRYMIGRRELELVKTGTVLINTARGGIVAEDALYEFLKNHQNACAALDVLEDENTLKNRLMELDNVIVTPHIAAYNDLTLQRMFESAVRNLVSFFNEKEGENA